MVRVATQGRYRVYVYAEKGPISTRRMACRNRVYVYAEKGGRHNSPHCHVEWPDGSCVVAIDSLAILRGHENRRAVELVRDNQSQVRAAWDQLNEEGA